MNKFEDFLYSSDFPEYARNLLIENDFDLDYIFGIFVKTWGSTNSIPEIERFKRDMCVVADYLSGMNIVALGVKYRFDRSLARYIIRKYLDVEIIRKTEDTFKNVRHISNLSYVSSVRLNIIDDYKSCLFNVEELTRKYNICDTTILGILHGAISEQEFYNIRRKILSNRCGYTLDFCMRIVSDYRTRNYRIYELANLYNIPETSVASIIQRYICKKERVEIQNFQYNRDYVGDIPKWRRFGIEGSVYSNKCGKIIYCRSLLEMIAIRILENDENVLSYSYEPFRITYCDTYGDSRTYIPDFKVEYKDGKVVIVEVKMEREVQFEINKLKFNAAIDFCKDNNMEFIVWTDMYIKGADVE